jgi:hypothetical protein
VNEFGGVESTAAELNALHSQGAVAADFAKLHAITASAAQVDAKAKSEVFVNDAGGYPLIDAGDFNVLSVIGAAWESVGPTGSGAANTWASLDSVSAGADWVKIRIYMAGVKTGSTADSQFYSLLYARKTGTAASTTGQDAIIAAINYYTTAAGNGSDVICVEHTVPIDASRRFDLYVLAGGTAPATVIGIRLVGYGVNP